MIERYSLPRMKYVWSDKNKFGKWLDVEIAVCDAWAEAGVVPKAAMPKIKLAKCNMKRMEEILAETHHDMTAFIGSVAESLGDESRFIHLGLTSSDVMDTALSLQLVEAAAILTDDIKDMLPALEKAALEHKYTLMMGRTHGVHAEPITFGLKLAIWVEEMRRNLHRLADATKSIAVGKISGAVGTYATVTPEVEQAACRKLKIAPSPISNQVLQRDRQAHFMTTLAIIAGSLEKFSTEIRALQKTEVREVEEPFAATQTGSSAMPHKRNPELCERISGMSRLIRGYASTALENIALWHERDISHSSTERIIFPDACLLLDYMMTIFTSIIRGMHVYPQQMKKNLETTRGLVFSQRVMLALIGKGLSRQQAYEMVKRNAMKTWQGKRTFLYHLGRDEELTAVIAVSELEKLFDYDYYMRHVDDIFQRLGLTRRQMTGNLHDAGDLSPRSV